MRTCHIVFKFLLLSSLLFVSAATVALSQDARRFDEFGDLMYSDLIARLDNFAVEIQNHPDARGFIVIYRTKRDLPGLNQRLAMKMKDYLVNSRGISKTRVVFVDGGVAENLTNELWIVPPGAAPKPRNDMKIGLIETHDSAWKFDEQNFLPVSQYRKFGLKRDREAEAERLEGYANEVRKQLDQIACLIVYAQYTKKPGLVDYAGDYDPKPETRLDPPGTARQKLLLDRNYLLKVYGLPASRIRIIDGGYRKRRAVEYWIVPAGEPMPRPTPNSFPKRWRRQK